MSGVDTDFLDRLAAGATPVTRRGGFVFSMMIAIGALASAAIVMAASGLRDDIVAAPASPIFLWKLLSMLAIALAALVLLYRSGRPGAATRQLAWLPTGAASSLLLLPLLALAATEPAMASDIRMSSGIYCLWMTSLAAIPVWIAALAWLRMAAPTNLARASWAAGMASAAVAATAFALHCPHDVIPYVVLWYGGAIALVSALTRLVLPALIRW